MSRIKLRILRFLLCPRKFCNPIFCNHFRPNGTCVPSLLSDLSTAYVEQILQRFIDIRRVATSSNAFHPDPKYVWHCCCKKPSNLTSAIPCHSSSASPLHSFCPSDSMPSSQLSSTLAMLYPSFAVSDPPPCALLHAPLLGLLIRSPALALPLLFCHASAGSLLPALAHVFVSAARARTPSTRVSTLSRPYLRHLPCKSSTSSTEAVSSPALVVIYGSPLRKFRGPRVRCSPLRTARRCASTAPPRFIQTGSHPSTQLHIHNLSQYIRLHRVMSDVRRAAPGSKGSAGMGNSSCVSGRAVASPGRHQAGHHMGAHGGSGCAPEDNVPSAAASWRAQRTAPACLVANLDQQTGRWRPARSARHRARRNPSHLRRKSACLRSAASRSNGKHLGNTFEREKRLKTKTFTSPDSDVSFPGNKPVSQRSTPLTFQCDFCVSMIRREPTSDCSKEQNTACRGALGTSTRAVACALTSKPQPLLLLHSTGAVASTIKSRTHRRCRRHGQRIKVRSFSNVTVSLIVEVTVEKQRSAPQSAALELQGSGAPRAPATFNKFGNLLQATSPFPHSSRNQIGWYYGKDNNTHSMERAVEKQRGRPPSLRLLTHWTALRRKSRKKKNTSTRQRRTVLWEP